MCAFARVGHGDGCARHSHVWCCGTDAFVLRGRATMVFDQARDVDALSAAQSDLWPDLSPIQNEVVNLLSHEICR